MSDTKFTKGEWDWCHDESAASMISVFNLNGVEICRLQSEDDAHLIAAAPEMYEMLESLREDYGLLTAVGKDIDNLLAKARGE